MSASVTYRWKVFRLHVDDPKRISYAPFGALDFIYLMGDRDGTFSPDVTGMRVDGDVLVFDTALGTYRLTGDVPNGVIIKWPT